MEVSDPQSTLMAGLVAATFILTEVAKRTELIPQQDRWLPLVSVTIGVTLGLAYQVDFLQAILIGASASGIYTTVKRQL